VTFRRNLLGAACAAAILLTPARAGAHEVFGLTGFPASVLHPLIIIDHALAIAALSLLAGQQPLPGMAAKLVALLLSMVLGFAALLYLPTYTGAPLLPLVAAALCGGLVAWGPALPGWACALSIGLAGFAIGLNTIPEAGILLAFLYALGGAMICAGTLLLVVGYALRALKRDWQRTGIRIVGSWIAASAMLVLALALGR
jgi:urease accessory protein